MHSQILLYNFKNDIRTLQIRHYLTSIGCEIREVSAPEYLKTLGYLFSLPGFSKNPMFNLGQNFSEEMLVMKDFSSEQIDGFLAFFRAMQLKPVALKAVLTPVTQHWNSIRLFQELQKEHAAMKRP